MPAFNEDTRVKIPATIPEDTSKYELYFPDKKILQKELQQWLDEE